MMKNHLVPFYLDQRLKQMHCSSCWTDDFKIFLAAITDVDAMTQHLMILNPPVRSMHKKKSYAYTRLTENVISRLCTPPLYHRINI